MGPSPSQNKTQQQPNEAEALVINHPKFNNVRVVSLPVDDDQGAIEILVPLPTENQFKKWQGQVSQLKQGENIFLPSKRKFEKTEFCGSGGIATLTYKYYPYLLRDEVVNRCHMEGKFFEEGELWYLVYSVISAAESFHAKGEKVGDIRPQNVFISPEGQVRVATQHSWPGEQTNYLKAIFQKQSTYLSPEELKDISYGKLEESANFALNQSFSIGLTCLDAATLFDCSKLYEPNNKFNYTKLDERIQELEKSGNYSVPLVLLIKGLCQVQGDKRVSCRQLIEWLSKYETPIIELQDFVINQIPEKLHRLSPPKPQKPQFQAQLPPISNLPPANYISQPSNPQPVLKTNNPPQFLPQFNTNYLVNGNPIVRPQSYQVPQLSSNNFTYKNQVVQRATVDANAGIRGNINFKQIDQQLQNSRKLYPS